MTPGDLHQEIVRRFEAIAVDSVAAGDRLVHNPKHTNETPSDKDRRFTLRPRRMYLLTPEQGGTGSCEYRIEYELVVNYNASSEHHVSRAMNDALLIINAIWTLTSISAVTMVDDTNQEMDDQAGPYEHRREFSVDFDPDR